MQSCIVGRPPVERSHKAHIFHCIINHDENLTLKVYFSCRLFCGLLEISQMIALEYLSKAILMSTNLQCFILESADTLSLLDANI